VLVANHFGAVVVDRQVINASAVLALVTESVGRPTVENADVAIWLGRGAAQRWS
jgi:hypothetical protein